VRATATCLLLFGGVLTSTPAPAQAQAADLTEVERFIDGDPDAGAKLYKRYCSGCHGADGRGGAHTFMPHVQNLTRKDYIELVPDGYLYLVIAEGGEAVGKNSYMPAWQSTLSEQDIKDVIAHIRALPTY
jgi:mono/diheme cytochrome c family protein